MKFTSLWSSTTSELSPLLEQDVPDETLKVRPREPFLTLVTNRTKRRSPSVRILGRQTLYFYHQSSSFLLNPSPSKAVRFAMTLAVLALPRPTNRALTDLCGTATGGVGTPPKRHGPDGPTCRQTWHCIASTARGTVLECLNTL